MARDPEQSIGDEARELLRQSGMRCTRSRLLVLQSLMDAAAPRSHAELAEELVPLGFDQATVYRNLTDLTEAGLLGRMELGDRIWRFEFRPPQAHPAGEHPHFMCTDCGRVSCLPDVQVAITQDTGKRFGGEICAIYLKGRCDSCT